MRCPFCGHFDSQVKDSRPTEDNAAIRRRRFCSECGSRWTTFERVQLRELTVVKKEGGKALRKRPVEQDRVERIVNSIQRQLEASGEVEIPTKAIGQMVMDNLRELDQVGYVRFASVYRNFREAKDFEDFVENLGDLELSTNSN